MLALGGPPTFQPAGHEHIARVRGALDRPQQALAAAGDRDAARRTLEPAVAQVPDLRREARNDPLLAE